MPKKYEMDKEVYIEREFYYKHELMSSQDIAELFENLIGEDRETDEDNKEKIAILKDKLIVAVKYHVDHSLTKRQREAVHLFLVGKNQETTAFILNVSQVAINSRLGIALKRLKNECSKDEAIKDILKQLKIL